LRIDPWQLRWRLRRTVIALLLVTAALGACSGGLGQERPATVIRASSEASRELSFALHGAVLHGDAYVFLEVAPASVTRVTFDVVSSDGVPALRRESGVAPFDLMGAAGELGIPWDTRSVGDGRYRLSTVVEFDGGTVVEAVATFDVINRSAAGRPGIWQPTPGTTWQWQLTGPLDTSVDAEVFDIDLFDTPAATIEELQQSGRRVICYFSAGTLEPWRPDAEAFPGVVIGQRMSGWDEYWLDVRRIDLLAPILRARLDLAAEKGCDAVEPDNVDAYLNATGFPLDHEDQTAFNRFLAAEAHARGLAIGLKNAVELIPTLVDDFDFAVNEECYRWSECDTLLPFVEAGKAVFGAEYGIATTEFCPITNALGLDFILKRRDLGADRETCR
jgi:hypothetical protein